MPPGQQEFEQSVANIDKVIAAFQCDRQSRAIIETAWQLIVQSARVSTPAKGKEPTPPAK